MKILFINSVVDYGSTGKIVRDLANGLKARGNDVKIAFGRHTAKDTTDTIDLTDKLATLFHVFMTRLFGRHGMHSTRATRKLIKYIRTYQPDVIHMHNLHGYYLNVPLLLKELRHSDARLLLTLHDCWTFSGNSAYFNYHGCRIWENGCVECNSVKDYPEVVGFVNQSRNYKWKQELFSALNNLTVVTPSNWLTSLTKDTFLGEYPVITVYNGIDLELFKPVADVSIEGVSTEDTMILGVSSIWEHRKGLEYFLELQKHSSLEAKIVLVGLTDKQINELPEGIIGITRTNSIEELAKIYSRANVFVNPTLEDNFPTTNLESLACGTPVVTFNTGGSPEAIDENTGIVVKENRVDSLLKSIEMVLDGNYSQQSCVQRANDLFGKQDMVEKYIDLILEKGALNA